MLLSDLDLHVNAVVYLAQHLIVLLDPAIFLSTFIMPIVDLSFAREIMPAFTLVRPPRGHRGSSYPWRAVERSAVN